LVTLSRDAAAFPATGRVGVCHVTTLGYAPICPAFVTLSEAESVALLEEAAAIRLFLLLRFFNGSTLIFCALAASCMDFAATVNIFINTTCYLAFQQPKD